MPLKVLLIDDEYIVLKGLEAMLLGQNEVKLQITLAVDAVDALKKLPQLHPDVIITDINMPEIDGLSMIEKILAQNYHCKFIIISGYENLEYLKKAIHLQVSDYLFKPIDKIQLINKLIEFDKEKKEKMTLTLFKLKMFFLHGELTKDYGLSDEEIMLALPCQYCVFSISIHNSLQENKTINDSLLQYFENVYWFSQGNQTIFLLNFSARLTLKEIYNIWNHCSPNHPAGLYIIDIKAQENPFMHLNVSQLHSSSLTNLILEILPITPKLRSTVRAQSSISNNTLSIASKVLQNDCPLNDYTNILYHSGLSLQEIHLKAFVEIFVCYLTIFGVHISEENIIKTYQQQLAKINGKHTLTLILQDMLTIFWHTILDEATQLNYSEKIRQVCSYIQQNYCDDLSLEQLGELVNLNPSYLSYLFKKEVDITFLQHLHKVRIQKSCELLRKKTGISIETISEQVGYRSTTYFHKVFREHVGMSPRQWQLQNE